MLLCTLILLIGILNWRPVTGPCTPVSSSTSSLYVMQFYSFMLNCVTSCHQPIDIKDCVSSIFHAQVF